MLHLNFGVESAGIVFQGETAGGCAAISTVWLLIVLGAIVKVGFRGCKGPEIGADVR